MGLGNIHAGRVLRTAIGIMMLAIVLLVLGSGSAIIAIEIISVSASPSDLNFQEVLPGGGSWGIRCEEAPYISLSTSPDLNPKPTGGGCLYYGATATVTAQYVPGYTFYRWSENGNTVSTSASYMFTVNRSRNLVAVYQDITPPTISISSPSDGQSFNTNTVTVSGIAYDSVGLNKVEVSVNSGSWQTVLGTDSWSTSVTLSPDSNTIYARATDNFGNIDVKSINVTYDPIPPTISISSPSDGQSFNTNTVTVSGTAYDNVGIDKVEAMVNSGSWQLASGNTSWSKQVTLSSDTNTIYVRATDTAGNTAEKSINVTYDPILPIISISSPSDGQSFSTNTITVNGTASDNVRLDNVEVRGNSESWQLVSGTTSWSTSVNLRPGSNTIYARATDTAGNTVDAKPAVTVIYDNTLPDISISSPSNGQSFNTNTVIVSGTAYDNVGIDKVEVRVNSGSWQLASGTTSWSTSVNLSPGSNTIYARAIDTAGNIAETSASADLVVPAVPSIWWGILVIFSIIGGVLGSKHLYTIIKPPPPNIGKQFPIVMETRGGIEGIGPRMRDYAVNVEVRGGVERL